MTVDNSRKKSGADAKEIDRRAADWLAARDGGRWDDQQEAALQSWLAQSTSHRVSFLRLENAWKRAERLRVDRDPNPATVDHTLRRATVDVQNGPRRRWPRSVPYSIAAGFAAIVAIGMFALMSRGDAFTWDGKQILATAVGERAIITLSDGSRLTLNTATRVRAEMDGTERRVWLDSGEAFFEVAHDASRPFVVEAGNQRVRVIGTKFSLRREGDDLQTRVVEGKVQIVSASGASTLLTADDTADATATTVRVQRKSRTVLDAELSWLHGALSLDGMTLDQAAAEFNRYNRRKLRVLDPSTGATVMGGTFDAANVEGFANLLRTGFGLKVHITSDEITIDAPTGRSSD